MRRRQQQLAARATGQYQSREVDFPLPLQGQRSRVKNADFSGLSAAELINLQSDGLSLVTPKNYSLEVNQGIGVIPFEFGTSVTPIIVAATGFTKDGTAYTTPLTETPSYAYLSGNAVMVIQGRNALRFDGTDFRESNFTSGDVEPTELDGIIAHQDRVFLWKTGSELNFYYGDVGAVTGQLAEFPLGRLGNITGTIVAMKSLTVDAGHGMNDTLAIFTSTGYVVGYEGLDPGDANDWRQLHRIKVPSVIDERAFVEVGSDLWMLTAGGVLSVRNSLQQGNLALVNTISDAIQDELVKEIAGGGTWSMHLAADAQNVIINCVDDEISKQWILDTDSKGWSRTTYPAREWFNDGLKTKFITLEGQVATLGDDGEEAMFATKWVSSWFRAPRATGICYVLPTILAKGPLAVSVTILSDHDGTGNDVTEAAQTVTIQPDNPADGASQIVSLNEIIGCDTVGSVFQLTVEVTAKWAQIVNMKVALQ